MQILNLKGHVYKHNIIMCTYTHLLFIIMISDINKDILSSKIISFADDTRVYTNITQIENSASLQTDLNYIYLWAINNNMLFNHQ